MPRGEPEAAEEACVDPGAMKRPLPAGLPTGLRTSPPLPRGDGATAPKSPTMPYEQNHGATPAIDDPGTAVAVDEHRGPRQTVARVPVGAEGSGDRNPLGQEVMLPSTKAPAVAGGGDRRRDVPVAVEAVPRQQGRQESSASSRLEASEKSART